MFSNRLRPFIVFGYGMICGVAIVKFVTPLTFLRLKEGEVFASSVFFIGLLSFLFHMMLEKRITDSMV